MNLMNSDHKATNDKYRMGYDGIRWESKCRPPAWATTKELWEDYKSGFGMIPLRTEGAPIHPDDPNCPVLEDERKQAFRYFDFHGGGEGLRYYDEWRKSRR